MSDAEPARKKARKQVQFRDDSEIPGPSELYRKSNDEDNRRNNINGTASLNSMLPPKFFDGLEESEMKNTSLCSEDILSEENEFWLLRCPANIDLKTFLLGSKISLDGVTELECEGSSETYEVVGLPRRTDGEVGPSLVALLPDENGDAKLVGAPLSGHLLIREGIQELPLPKLLPEPKQPHKIPEGIKERHPIYGTNFEEVFQAIEASSKSKKKKKKSKHREEPALEEQPAAVVEYKEKSKRKSKKSKDSELSSPIISSQPLEEKSKRKSKIFHHDTELSPETNSYSVITEETPKRKKSKNYLNNTTTAEISYDSPNISESKSKKKRERSEMNSANGLSVNGYANGNVSDLERSYAYSNGKFKVKKEKLDHSVLAEPEASPEKRKKSKKSRHTLS